MSNPTAYDELYVYTMGRSNFILQHVVDAQLAQTATEAGGIGIGIAANCRARNHDGARRTVTAPNRNLVDSETSDRPRLAIIRPMWTFFLWVVLLCGAGLCYPRRPRLAGGLFIATGVLAIALTLTRNHGNLLIAIPGVFWLALGGWYLVKYRHSDVRAKHVEYWTAKA